MKSTGKTEILLAQLFMVNFNPFQWIVASHVGKLCHWIFILCQRIFIQTCQKTLKSMKLNLLLVNGHQTVRTNLLLTCQLTFLREPKPDNITSGNITQTNKSKMLTKLTIFHRNSAPCTFRTTRGKSHEQTKN